MDSQTKSSLLPYILDLLSRQPELCTTVDELCEQINDVVLNDHISPFGTLKKAVEFALEVGMNLGIISLTQERVRVPFNFRKGLMEKDQTPKTPMIIDQRGIKRLSEMQRIRKQKAAKAVQAAKAASRARLAMSDISFTSKRSIPVIRNRAKAIRKSKMAPKRSVVRRTAVRRPNTVNKRKVGGPTNRERTVSGKVS